MPWATILSDAYLVQYDSYHWRMREAWLGTVVGKVARAMPFNPASLEVDVRVHSPRYAVDTQKVVGQNQIAWPRTEWASKPGMLC